VHGENLKVDLGKLSPFPAIGVEAYDLPVDSHLQTMKYIFKDWNDDVSNLEDSTTSLSSKTGYTIVLTLMPYALALALALQFVKAAYEKRD
jgi:hypothetical protein